MEESQEIDCKRMEQTVTQIKHIHDSPFPILWHNGAEFTPIAILELDLLASLFSFEELKEPSTAQQEHGYQNAVETEDDCITRTRLRGQSMQKYGPTSRHLTNLTGQPSNSTTFDCQENSFDINSR